MTDEAGISDLEFLEGRRSRGQISGLGVRMRRAMTFALGSMFGLALVATCGTKSASVTLDDMGRVVGDLLGVKDAKASTPMSSDCSLSQVFTQTATGVTIATTTYFAEFDIAALDPTTAPQISAVTCDQTYFGNSTAVSSCSPSYTCSTTGYAPDPSLTCTTSSYARIGPSKILVTCGSKSDVTYTGNPPAAANTTSGSKATKVYVSVQ